MAKLIRTNPPPFVCCSPPAILPFLASSRRCLFFPLQFLLPRDIAFPQPVPPLLKPTQHLSPPNFDHWCGSERRRRSPPVSPALGAILALNVLCSKLFVGLWCCGTRVLVWALQIGLERRSRRCAPQHHGATAGTLGPVAARLSFLPGRVLEGVWVLLELIPTSGWLWCHRHSVAAVAERLQLRAAVSCADGLQREGEKEGRGCTERPGRP
jgi:hypothetical protein